METNVQTTGPFPYTSPADSASPKPAAHGGVTYIDTCTRTGATRKRNVNGAHEEVGRWAESVR